MTTSKSKPNKQSDDDSNYVQLNHLDIKDIDSDLKAAIADCIIAWAQVETSLCFIFTKIVSPEILVGGKLWDSIVNFRDKLSAIDNMMMIIADKSHISDWTKLSEKISKKSKKRNEIAHAAVTEIKGKMVLIPYLSIIDISHDDLVYYTANEIRERAKSFINLRNEIDQFFIKYFFDQGQLPVAPAQDGGPVMQIRVRVGLKPSKTQPSDQSSEE